MAERQILTARLRRAVDLSERTKHLEFEVEEIPRFDFIAGQFISMKAIRLSDQREITRAYSIASPPRGDNTLDLCLNRVEEGFFSNHLCDLPVGGEVKFHGPHGYFVLKNPLRDSILIATGTGIAPMRGMLEWLFKDEARHTGRQLWLVFGSRFQRDIYYHEEFEQMAREHPNFHYISTLSRPEEAWKGARGYVQEQVREIARGRTDMDAYICGLEKMVTANRTMLLEMGWDKKSVVFERFD